MKSIRCLIMLSFLALPWTPTAKAVEAMLPDVTATPGETILMPITVLDLVDLEGMEITLNYDATIADNVDISLDDSVLMGLDYALQTNLQPGQVTLIFYANGSLFSGSGVVANLTFDYVDGASLITFSQFSVNEIDYLAFVTHGSIGPVQPTELQVDFTASPRSGPPPLAVTFLSTSTAQNGEITTWEWDFDGDNIVDAIGPGPHTHTFPLAQMYDVSLHVEAGNLSDTELKTDYIAVGFYDINGDGLVNMADVTNLVNIILDTSP